MQRSMLLALLALLSMPIAAAAQEINLDRSVSAGELVLFQSIADEASYYYAPASARLAENRGKPKFSFLRYVENVVSQEEVREGEGGGIVHAVVQLGVSDRELDEARGELQRQVPGAKIAGPIVFRSGRFGLVSAFENEKGDLTQQVVGLGTAPVLDGGKAAVSIQLTRRGAKLLWESFQTSTPDISFLFEMELVGYRSPKRALIEADMERVYAHRAFEAGIATPYLQTEVSDAMEDLYREGAIRLTQIGEDEDLESLIETAYSKLTELVFASSDGALAAVEQAKGGQRKSALDRASALLETRRKEARTQNDRARAAVAAHWKSIQDDAATAKKEAEQEAKTSGADRGETEFMEARAALMGQMADAVRSKPSEGGAAPAPEAAETIPLPDFAAVVLYEMKRSRQQGTYRIDLNKYTPDTIGLRFDENVGDLRRYMDDDDVFRSVNLDDPMFRQREIIAALQGVNASAFEDAIAYVTVQARKQHQNGDETFSELVIDRSSFNDEGNRFKFVYGWKGDEDREAWKTYQYRTVWSFQEADPMEGEWVTTSDTAIPLRPPFETRRIELDAGGGQELSNAGVRSVNVVLMDASGAPRRITLNTSRGELSKSVDLILPRGQNAYEYEIQWSLKGNETRSSGKQSGQGGILYLDELPQGAAS